MKFTHEYDPHGCHRLVVTEGHQVLSTGFWAGNQQPASVVAKGSRYVAWTNYMDGYFEAETVYIISPHTSSTINQVALEASSGSTD